MSTEYLRLILDIIILIGLGGFMYYALRLSRALNDFRSYRNEFQSVIRQLNSHIESAQQSIHTIKNTTTTSGEDLKKVVRDAQYLADDLQIMNQTGNKIASRLEGLIDKSRQSDDRYHENVSDISKHRKSDHDEDELSFLIQDREFEDDFLNDETESFDDDPAMNDLSSEAEKELYEALKRTGGNKKRKA